MTSLQLCYVAAGVFFLTGLASGVWKYAGILKTKEAEAPVYVSILHRAALMYSFASILLAKFVELNPYPEAVKFWSALSVLAFFTFALLTYFLHGILQDTDNQMRKPHRLGAWILPAFATPLSMALLVIAEIGGFVVLFYGYLVTL